MFEQSTTIENVKYIYSENLTTNDNPFQNLLFGQRSKKSLDMQAFQNKTELANLKRSNPRLYLSGFAKKVWFVLRLFSKSSYKDILCDWLGADLQVLY